MKKFLYYTGVCFSRSAIQIFIIDCLVTPNSSLLCLKTLPSIISLSLLGQNDLRSLLQMGVSKNPQCFDKIYIFYLPFCPFFFIFVK